LSKKREKKFRGRNTGEYCLSTFHWSRVVAEGMMGEPIVPGSLLGSIQQHEQQQDQQQQQQQRHPQNPNQFQQQYQPIGKRLRISPAPPVETDTRSCGGGCFFAPLSSSSATAVPLQPVVRSDFSDTDLMLAKELNQMSMTERDQILSDIHGVADLIVEEPDFVDQCLMDLETILVCTEPSQKIAYEQARAMNLAYVQDRNFLIKCLRADEFQVKKTAERLLLHMEIKLELFGPEKLCQEITLQDLNEDDIRALETGFIQLLPERDRAGRAVMVLSLMFIKYKEFENMVGRSSHCVSLRL
jgi:hypothetical protein